MPISDELHDLVGNPVPPGDLGQRARARATEIKRRRLAGLATSVVAVTVLAVPGALLVRDQSGNVNGAVGSGSESPNPAATSATADVKRVVVPAPTEVRAGTLTSRDRTRAATALSLLGKGFTQTGSGQVVAVKTGKLVGASATFTATNGGGTVAVQWTEGVGIAYAVTAPGLAGVPALPSAAIASAAVASAAPAVASAVGTPPSGAAASAVTAIVVVGGGSSLPSASADPGEPNSVTSESGGNTLTTPGTFSAGTVWTGGVGGDINGMVSVNGNLALSIKVVQGTAGSPRILSGKAALAFANALAKALR